MGQHFPTSYKGNINVKVDLSNYAKKKKKDLKTATEINTSNFAGKLLILLGSLKN